MGNTSTKERASSPVDGSVTSSSSRRHRHGDASSSSTLPTLGREGYSSRSRSRHNLENTLFGLSVSSRETRDRDREADKASREQRRQERERDRLRERERSLKEDRVDGGFLVTQGVYTATEDFKDKIVRQFMIERRLAPFFKGVNDHEDDWTDAQLYAAAHCLEIPGPDAEPPKEKEKPKLTAKSVGSSDNLTVPIASRSRSQSYTSETSNRSNSSTPTFGFSSCRTRAKTISISSPKNPTLPTTSGPVESNDPSTFIDGRPIEAVLYKNAVECPICFMYYPPYLNKTRCCDQEICSECFVGIKRTDPHIPENHDNTPNPNANLPDTPSSIADQLVSEPACCPFCKQPEFGVTYSPPPFRRGLYYASKPGTSTFPFPGVENGGPSNDSNGSNSASPPQSPTGRRRMMLSVTNPDVVTTDQIRPDWSQKLATARAHAARRAAAATALHTAAYLMGGNTTSGSGSGGYSRRLIRRARDGERGSESPSPGASGAGTPDGATRGSLLGLHRNRDGGTGDNGVTVEQRLATLGFISPRESSRERTGLLGASVPRADRRSRMVDLEEMMLMEAIRLSLAEEEERKARQRSQVAQNESAKATAAAAGPADNKGKSVDRVMTDPNAPGPSSTYATNAGSNASSTSVQLAASRNSDSGSNSSFASAPETNRQSVELEDADDGSRGTGEESMFNFRSLAAVITAEDREGDADGDGHAHVEHVTPAHGVPVVVEEGRQIQRVTIAELDKGTAVDVGVHRADSDQATA